ncbi:hypothetical protein RB195_003933 [Necator americanus]|uniref:Uncharacterized protein n=1 Tax=Necator americanus TaxID=51031 RepID=A0ABR1DQV4_NECAM
MSGCKHVVAGITNNGETICMGVIEMECGTVVPVIHHVASMNKFEAEDWDGDHAETHYEQPADDEDAQHTSFSAETAEVDTATAVHGDEDTPIASSGQFERNRSASLAEALLHIDPNSVPQVSFFHPSGVIPLLEAEESEERVPTPVAASETEATADELPEVGNTERVIANLILTLDALKMAAPDRHTAAVNRLKELEEELRTAGAVTPADPAVADAVARALTAAGPGRDVQIRVNQSRHTTTTKTVYETETPGMVGLDPEKIRELHQQMLGSLTSAGVEAAPDTGTTQKKETAEEGYTNEDGSVVVSKKMTRVVTTTKTTLPGDAEPTPESSPSTFGSVRERIARFESLQEIKSTKSSPDKLSVDIVVTPGTPARELESDHDDVAQEPLSPSIESEVSQAEVKSSSSYSGEEHVPKDYEELERRGKRQVIEEEAKRATSPETTEVPHAEQKAIVAEYGAHPSTFIETTTEEIIELEERSESPQAILTRKKPQEDEQIDVIPAIPIQEESEESPKLAETRTTFITSSYYGEPEKLAEQFRREKEQEQPPVETAVTGPNYEDMEPIRSREEHEYRTVKKTVTTVTTTRYMEMPEAATPEPKEEESVEEIAVHHPKHEPSTQEQDYPTVTKTVTTVTTTSYMEVPETPETDQLIEHDLIQNDEKPTSSYPSEEQANMNNMQDHKYGVSEPMTMTSTFPQHDEKSETLTEWSQTQEKLNEGGRATYTFGRHPDKEEEQIIVDQKDFSTLPKTLTTVTTVSPATQEEYLPTRETVTTVTTTCYEEKPELPGDIETHKERKSPVSPIEGEEYPPVKETVTRVTTYRYEEKREHPGDFETYKERESPVRPIKEEDYPQKETATTVTTIGYEENPEHPGDFERYKERESPVSPIKEEDYPLKETVTTVTTTGYGEKPEILGDFERYKERESPVSPIKEEDYPLKETVTTVTTTGYGEKPEILGDFERYKERESPVSPIEGEEYPPVKETVTTVTTYRYEEKPEHPGDFERYKERESPVSPIKEEDYPLKETVTTVTTTGYGEKPEILGDFERYKERESPVSPIEGEEYPPVKETVTTVTTYRYEEKPEHPGDFERYKERESPVSPIKEEDYPQKETVTTVITTGYGEKPEILGDIEGYKERESPVSPIEGEDYPQKETVTTVITTGYGEKPEILGDIEGYKERESPVSPIEGEEYPPVKETVTTVTTYRYEEKPEHPGDFERYKERESPVSPIEGEEYPPVKETVTTVTTYRYEEKPEHPGDFERYKERESPVSPIEGEEYPPVKETVTTVTTYRYEEKPEHPGDFERYKERESPVSPIEGEEYPPVKETVTTVTTYRYEEKPEHPGDFERYKERESPVSPVKEEDYPQKETVTTVITTGYGEKPEILGDIEGYKERESPVSPIEGEEYPPVKETVTTVTTYRYEEKPEHPGDFERYKERESPVSPIKEEDYPQKETVTTVITTGYGEKPEILGDIEGYKERESPVSPIEGEDYPQKETVTTVTTTGYGEKPEILGDFERYKERESPVSPIEGEEYPPVKETVTTVTTYRHEEKPEHPGDFERYKERESPVSSIKEEDYPQKETVTTVTTTGYGEKPEILGDFERYKERESPVSPIEGEEYPPVKETVTTVTTYRHEEKPEYPGDFERYKERESLVSPIKEEDYPQKETATTVTTIGYEENPEHPGDFEGYKERESPVSPIKEEDYPLKETVTTVRMFEEKKELPKQIEKYPERESPAVAEPPLSTASREDFLQEEKYPPVKECATTYEEEPSDLEKLSKHMEQKTPQSPEKIRTQVVREESQEFNTEKESPSDETTQPSFGDRLAGFATKAAKIAGGAVVAPVALAAMGASAAYEAITKDEGPKIRDDEDSYALAEPSPKKEKFEEIETHGKEETPVSTVSREELFGEKYPAVTETVTTVTTFEEKPEVPEEYEKYLGRESPVAAEPPKAVESPVSTVSREEIIGEKYPTVTETVTTVTTFEEKPEVPEEYEKYLGRESPVAAEPLKAVESAKAEESPVSTVSREELFGEKYPTVTETVTTVTTFEEKPEVPEEYEKYLGRESPVAAESPKAVESPVSTVSREELFGEKYPAVTETVTTVTTFEEKPEVPEEYEKYLGRESPVAAEPPKAVESPVSTVSREELFGEKYPAVTETVTTVTTFEEKPEVPEEYEEYLGRESPVAAESPKAVESPVSTVSREELFGEKYPAVTETVTTVTTFEEKPEVPEEYEKYLGRESPVAAEPPKAVESPVSTVSREEIIGEKYPTVTETVTTVTTFEEKPEVPEEYEKYLGRESPVAAEPLKAVESAKAEESPVSTVSREELFGEKYPAVTETVTTVTTFEEKPEVPEEYEKYLGRESPVAAEPPKAVESAKAEESPVSTVSREEIFGEKYPTVTETVTTVTTFEEKPEVPEEYEEYLGRESPVAAESPKAVESPVSTVSREEIFAEEYPPVKESATTHEEEPSDQEKLWKHMEEKLFESTEEIRTQVEREESPQFTTEKESLSDETTQPSFGDRLAGFATKAAKIAGGAVVAPVALAAMGASAAYEAITKDEGPKIRDDEDSYALAEPSPKKEKYEEVETYGKEETPVSVVSLEELLGEEAPTVAETMAAITTFEKPEVPEEYEKYLGRESPVAAEPPKAVESAKAEESPVSTVSREEIFGEKYPAVTETVTTVTTFEEKPEVPEEYEKYLGRESPVAAEPPKAVESAKAEESPVSTVSREEIFGEKYPTVTETVTTVTTFEEKPEVPEEYEKYLGRESPVAAEPPKARRSFGEKYPTVTETVTTVTTFEEKPEVPEEYEEYLGRESPVAAESPKAVESPVSTVSREEIFGEKYPTVTETVTTVTTFEEKPEVPEEYEKYLGRESPVAAESPKAVESPVSTVSREEIFGEKYPTVTETVTTVTTFEEKPEVPEEYEKYLGRESPVAAEPLKAVESAKAEESPVSTVSREEIFGEKYPTVTETVTTVTTFEEKPEVPEEYEEYLGRESPVAAESPKAVESPVSTVSREELFGEKYPPVKGSATTHEEEPSDQEKLWKHMEEKLFESTEEIRTQVEREESPQFTTEKESLSDETTQPSFGDRLAGFATKAAKIAGGAVVATSSTGSHGDDEDSYALAEPSPKKEKFEEIETHGKEETPVSTVSREELFGEKYPAVTETVTTVTTFEEKPEIPEEYEKYLGRESPVAAEPPKAVESPVSTVSREEIFGEKYPTVTETVTTAAESPKAVESPVSTVSREEIFGEKYPTVTETVTTVTTFEEKPEVPEEYEEYLGRESPVAAESPKAVESPVSTVSREEIFGEKYPTVTETVTTVTTFEEKPEVPEEYEKYLGRESPVAAESPKAVESPVSTVSREEIFGEKYPTVTETVTTVITFEEKPEVPEEYEKYLGRESPVAAEPPRLWNRLRLWNLPDSDDSNYVRGKSRKYPRNEKYLGRESPVAAEPPKSVESAKAEESPVSTVSREEIFGEKYPAVTETVTTVTTFEEKPEVPEEYEKYLGRESPVAAEPPKAVESPVSTVSREEIFAEEYPPVTETVTTRQYDSTTFEEKPEVPEEYEEYLGRESPVAAESPKAVESPVSTVSREELFGEKYPAVTETVTTVTTFEEKPEVPEEYEKYLGRESPVAAESPKAVESPVSTVSREEIFGEKYPTVTETVTTVTTFEEKPEVPEEYEKYLGRESPVAAESPKAVESPVSTVSREEIFGEKYPTVTETVTTVTTFEEKRKYPRNMRNTSEENLLRAFFGEKYPAVTETVTTVTTFEEKPEVPEEYEKYLGRESPVAAEPPKAVESPVSTVSREEIFAEEYPPVKESATTHEEEPSDQEKLWKHMEEKLFESTEEIRTQVEREESPQFTTEKESLSDETTQPSFGDRLAGFATKAAKIAGGAVVAPVALAAMGASAAYEAITKDEGPKIRDDEDSYALAEPSPKKEKFEEIETHGKEETPVSTVSREELFGEKYPAVTETVTTVTTFEEKPEVPEEYEKYLGRESPVAAEPPKAVESAKAEESPVSTVSREEIFGRNTLKKLWREIPYSDRDSDDSNYQRNHLRLWNQPRQRESPVSTVSREEIFGEKYPTVTETVTTVTTFEEKPEVPEEYEEYLGRESPVAAESPKAVESPVSTVSREEIFGEKYPTVTETVTTVTTFEEKPEVPEEYEKYLGRESPVAAESPKAVESPVSTVSREEIFGEKYPTVTETVTTVTTFEEKPEVPEEYEKYLGRESLLRPKAAESPKAVESPVSTVSREEISGEKVPYSDRDKDDTAEPPKAVESPVSTVSREEIFGEEYPTVTETVATVTAFEEKPESSVEYDKDSDDSNYVEEKPEVPEEYEKYLGRESPVAAEPPKAVESPRRIPVSTVSREEIFGEKYPTVTETVTTVTTFEEKPEVPEEYEK